MRAIKASRRIEPCKQITLVADLRLLYSLAEAKLASTALCEPYALLT